jgi:hypothetical protein
MLLKGFMPDEYQPRCRKEPDIPYSSKEDKRWAALSQSMHCFSTLLDSSAEQPAGILRILAGSRRTVRTRLVKLPS